MPLKLTLAAVHAMMPRAPAAYTTALVAGQDKLDACGATDSVDRLSYLFANVAQESGEFHEVIENINYSPARACQVWPSRFHSISDVYAKTGSFPGDPNFPTKLMDNVYGNRMGNRPGTHDGSNYIGRGALQLTGREEYGEMAQATGLDLVNQPGLTILPENQATILAAYVTQKGLNPFADRQDFVGYVRRINGGTIGLSDRVTYLRHIRPIVASLQTQTGGHDTAWIQESLNKIQNAGLDVDGIPGILTSAAVRTFQVNHPPLVVDGIAGPVTIKAIEDALAPAS